MTTVTYEELQTENLFTVDYSQVVNNFKTIDSFIKNFNNFQRKMTEMEKVQKATSHDLTNFKMSTSNTFSTMNEVLESRGSLSKGGNKEAEQAMADIKAQVKDLKQFLTESTRDINDAMELKEKETAEVYLKFEEKFKDLNTYHQSDKLRIQSLEDENYAIKAKYTLKTQTDIIKSNLIEAKDNIQNLRSEINETQQFLKTVGVKQFKDVLDRMSEELYSDMDNLKMKFKLKTDVSDTLKLEDMLLNTINFSYQSIAKKYCNKIQTKKALIFLERKINSIVQSFSGQQGEKDGLIATKGWKCMSCTKQLNQYDGKFDSIKAWSGFPAKDHQHKDKYAGFGSGFQSIVETAVHKKGGEVGFDEKGRMTTPFNLARQSRGNLKASQSQSKLDKSRGSPVKNLVESNYMNLFGRNSEVDLDIRLEYVQKEKGLKSTLKKEPQK